MATKSTHSIKSAASIKSIRSVKVGAYGIEIDFEEYMKMCLSKFECPYQVIVRKEIQHDYLRTLRNVECTARSRKISQIRSMPSKAKSLEKEESVTSKTMTEIEDDAVIVTTLYVLEKIVEISLKNLKVIPRVIMQILGLIIPLARSITRFNIKNSRINKYTIYELNKFLEFTNITEICLDDCPLPEANYTILLENPCRITYLSLCRCNINDDVCGKIASLISYPKSAETKLMVLNLTTNHITDIGAERLGLALRTNRHLRYLNLAGNTITDDGADHILDVLTEFPLTADEILAKRKLYFKYLKKKQELLEFFFNMDSKSTDNLTRKPGKKKELFIRKPAKKDKSRMGMDDIMRCRAESYAAEMVGPFIHPFSRNFTKHVDELLYCKGNFILCYLNLSHNNLSFNSVRKLRDVLLYQNAYKIPFQYGLLRVVLDGNYLPIVSTEMTDISELLNKNVVSFTGKYIERRRTRTISIVASK